MTDQKLRETFGLLCPELDERKLNLLVNKVEVSNAAAVRAFAEEVKTHWAYDPDNIYDSEYQIGNRVIYQDSGGRTYTLGEVIDQHLAGMPEGGR